MKTTEKQLDQRLMNFTDNLNSIEFIARKNYIGSEEIANAIFAILFNIKFDKAKNYFKYVENTEFIFNNENEEDVIYLDIEQEFIEIMIQLGEIPGEFVMEYIKFCEMNYIKY